MSTTTKATTKKAAQPAKADEAKDWTYLAEKDPSDLHEDFAAWMLEEIGLDLDQYADDPKALFVKAVQVTAVLRPVYQKSDRNKARANYRALPSEIVASRKAHMLAAHAEASAQIEARKAAEAKAKPAPKKAVPAKPATRKAAAPKPAAPARTRNATTPAKATAK